ncbi:hypothetical protein TNCV_2949951 [Trichonephila clavipes]|nr:hypothetical protein TNCV_2949951 [Trichonephila clavipes]
MFKKTNSVENKQRSGHPKIFKEREGKWIVRQAHVNPSISALKRTLQCEKAGSVENNARPGDPSKFTSRAKLMIVRSATNEPMTSALNNANELLPSCNVSMSAQTVRNVLHSAGLKARTPRKKPYISEVNRKRRL